MKVSRILWAGMLISQTLSLQAMAAMTAAEMEAMCSALKNKSTCIAALTQMHGEAKPPAAKPAVEKPKPAVQPVPEPIAVKPKPAVQPIPEPISVKPAPPVVQPPVVVKPAPPAVVQPQPAPPVVNPSIVAPTPVASGYQGPARSAGIKTAADNQAMFSTYCVGDSTAAATPQPNYSNAEVQKAARIMSKVADKNIYYYGDIKRIYKAGAPKPASQSAITDNAHLFLVQVCGEFRDRAEMIQGKIRWVNNMVLLGNEPQQPIDPKGQNVWAQVSGHSYTPYLRMSMSVYSARAQQAAADTYLKQNLHSDAQKAAKGFTVCETKYILSEYVAKSRSFSSLASFEEGYKAFESQCGYDAQGRADKDHYYDFRGDSNFKQYSPEANAMIWQAIAIARFCESPIKSNGKSSVITDQVCEDYYKRPFMSRYSAARSGLGAWMLYSKSEEEGFQNQSYNVTVFPSFDMKSLGVKPFSMKLSDGTQTSPTISMKDSTLGFNEMFGIGTSNADLAGAFKRLRNAVNRHTNWYASSFDDQLGHEKSVRDQAYSPFVASSYEMSASNGFTECGVTVQCEGDGRKAWMLVFKVHKDNWYNTDSLMKNQKIDFDKMWFDETTFGTDHLADSERAWDRMGTALETELDTILYLHNLEAGSGSPVANDKLD